MDGMNSWRVEADGRIRSRGRRKGGHVGPHRHRSGLRERRREATLPSGSGRCVLLKYRSIVRNRRWAPMCDRPRRGRSYVMQVAETSAWPSLHKCAKFFDAIYTPRVALSRARHARHPLLVLIPMALHNGHISSSFLSLQLSRPSSRSSRTMACSRLLATVTCSVGLPFMPFMPFRHAPR